MKEVYVLNGNVADTETLMRQRDHMIEMVVEEYSIEYDFIKTETAMNDDGTFEFKLRFMKNEPKKNNS